MGEASPSAGGGAVHAHTIATKSPYFTTPAAGVVPKNSQVQPPCPTLPPTASPANSAAKGTAASSTPPSDGASTVTPTDANTSSIPKGVLSAHAKEYLGLGVAHKATPPADQAADHTTHAAPPKAAAHPTPQQASGAKPVLPASITPAPLATTAAHQANATTTNLPGGPHAAGRRSLRKDKPVEPPTGTAATRGFGLRSRKGKAGEENSSEKVAVPAVDVVPPQGILPVKRPSSGKDTLAVAAPAGQTKGTLAVAAPTGQTKKGVHAKRGKKDLRKRRQPEPLFATTTRLFDTGIRSEFSFARELAQLKKVITPSVRRVCSLDPRGRPVPLDPNAVQNDVPILRRKRGLNPNEPFVEDLSDERFDKRHKHNELTERKRKQFNSHTTAFELQQEARRLREQQKEEESQQLEPSQQTDVAPKRSGPYSFWPRVVDLAGDDKSFDGIRVEIANELMVVAFGRMVPNFRTRKEFSLPRGGPNAFMLPEVESKKKSHKASNPEVTEDMPAAVASKRSGRVLKKPMKFISPPETPKRKRKTSALANSNKVAHALTLPGAVADGVKSKGRGKGNWGKGRGRGRGGRHATPNIGGVKSGKRVPGVAYRKHGTSVSTVQPGGMDDPELMMDNFLGDIRDIGVYDFGAASAHDAHDDQGGRSVIDGIVDSGMMSHAMSHSMPGVGGGINEQASVMDTISQMGVPVHGALEVFPGIESFEGLDSSAIPTSTSSIATASDAEDDLPLGPAYPSTTELPGMNWVNAIDTFAVDMSDEDDDVPLNIMHKGGRF